MNHLKESATILRELYLLQFMRGCNGKKRLMKWKKPKRAMLWKPIG